MIKNVLKLLFLLSIALFALPVQAQKAVRKHIKEGNSQYKDSLFLESEISYRKAIDVNAQDSIARYNLANSLYRQQKYEDALKQYLDVARQSVQADNRPMAADAFHNAGNVCMLAQDYAKAEEMFKQSLRYDPQDHETRYNFVLAQKLRQQQEQQQQDQQKQQQQQKMSKEQADKKIQQIRSRDQERRKSKDRSEGSMPVVEKDW